MFSRLQIRNRQAGFTTFELIIVLSVISTLSLFFYAKAFRPGLEAAKIRQISGVMENIADAVEQYALENNTAPATLADTGYVPPPHPFNGAYEFGADTAQGWVEAIAWLPAGRARVRGPANSLKNLNGTWDVATIRRPINMELWYDKKFLYNE
jgi:type II secretory pathway pseudopilin PulG